MQPSGFIQEARTRLDTAETGTTNIGGLWGKDTTYTSDLVRR